jgi:5-methylcytosine-specific restriction enzyme A
MPWMPQGRCTSPGCGRMATEHGRCERHQRPAWQQPSQHTLLMNPTRERKWRRLVKENANSICELCGAYAPRGQADHINPVADGGALYDTANGRWLCYPCHQRITIEENRQRAKARASRRARGDAEGVGEFEFENLFRF